MALLVRCPKCGETKEHPETVIGRILQCPGCDLSFLVAKAPDRGNYAHVVPTSRLGRGQRVYGLQTGPRTSRLATASLVAGLVGFVTLGVGGVVGLGLGLLGLRRISGNRQLKGRGLAVGGIGVSAVSIVLGLAVILFGQSIWYALTEPPDEATLRVLASLDAALQRYHEDWGKYPWIENAADGLMGAVDPDPKKNLRPAKGAPDDAEALLFAALNLRAKRGPYIPNAGMLILEEESDGKRYRVYCDGWGRPIHFGPPKPGDKKPLLESDGPDPDDPDDDLTNE
jgi:hypothetical protein